MKKTICYIACAIWTLAGLWLAIYANISDAPKDQGFYAILSAFAFCVAILVAGYGHSLPWKKDKE